MALKQLYIHIGGAKLLESIAENWFFKLRTSGSDIREVDDS